MSAASHIPGTENPRYPTGFQQSCGRNSLQPLLQHRHVVVKQRSMGNHCWGLSHIAPTASVRKRQFCKNLSLMTFYSFISLAETSCEPRERDEADIKALAARSFERGTCCWVIPPFSTLIYLLLSLPEAATSIFSSSVVNRSVLKRHDLLLFMHQHRYLCQDKESGTVKSLFAGALFILTVTLQFY